MKRCLVRIYFFIIVLFFLNSSIYSQINLDNLYRNEDGIAYSIVLPIDYNKHKKYILAVGLHGLYSDGNRMVNPFSYYSRYMNIILVCPDGNFPDNKRNGVKWGYEKSEKYILNLIALIKLKYRVYDDIFLFGFSQGGNQGLQTSLSNPHIFKHFAALSGGYSTLTSKQFHNSRKLNLLFISGDKGEGEIFTKNAMDARYLALQKHNPFISRKVFPGEVHEVTHAEAFYMFEWLYKVNKKSNFKNIVKEDYYISFDQSSKFLANSEYQESIKFAKESITKNRFFAPSYLNIASSYYLMRDVANFKKYFFPTLELYSTYSFFDLNFLLNFIEEIKLSSSDFLVSQKILEFLLSKIKESNPKISDIIKAEIYLLIAELHIIKHNSEFAKLSFKKALNSYQKINSKTMLFTDAKVKIKMEYIENYLKELEFSRNSK